MRPHGGIGPRLLGEIDGRNAGRLLLDELERSSVERLDDHTVAELLTAQQFEHGRNEMRRIG